VIGVALVACSGRSSWTTPESPTSVVLVTILSDATFATLIFSHAPDGQTLNVHFLQLPEGAGIGTVASAAVYGFLSFAGFEGAAALRDETTEPKRDIPHAIRVAVVVVGAFYLFTARRNRSATGRRPPGSRHSRTASRWATSARPTSAPCTPTC
jgi:hypothetical protein